MERAKVREGIKERGMRRKVDVEKGDRERKRRREIDRGRIEEIEIERLVDRYINR